MIKAIYIVVSIVASAIILAAYWLRPRAVIVPGVGPVEWAPDDSSYWMWHGFVMEDET